MAAFAGAVGAEAGKRIARRDRGDVDDGPPAALFHDRPDCFAEVNGSRQIDIDNLTPFVDGQFFDGAGRRVAGIIDERVDPAEMSHGIFHDLVGMFGVGDVTDNCKPPADDVGGDFQVGCGVAAVRTTS